jgi:large subunit ribosomal protein L31
MAIPDIRQTIGSITSKAIAQLGMLILLYNISIMNKSIQPKTHIVKFVCATCGTTYELNSTIKSDTVGLDVCSNCHQFYKGSAGSNQVKGRSEKLAAKFEAGRANIGVKKEASTKVRKSNKHE